MLPIIRRIPLETTFVTVYEWGTPDSERPSVICFHATSFHGRCWDQTIKALNAHVYAVDAVGHGTSGKPTPPRSWQQYGADVVQIAQALELRDAVGVGHSMGGNMLTRAAAAQPDAFSALILVDPVILPETQYVDTDYAIADHPILKRRTLWDSPDAMFERFKDREPFARWQRDVLRDYCAYGLVREGDQYRLACDPAVEAHIYASTRLAINRDIYRAVEGVRVPVRVLRSAVGVATSTDNLSLSPTAPDLAARFADGRDVPFPQYTHFLAMEAPDVVAGHIRDMMGV
ncbi:MAG: alpha/beta hydrolase [bacterium]|nr:alpha/beta hydrolase [bacterium]